MELSTICGYLDAAGLACFGFAVLGIIYHAAKDNDMLNDEYEDGSPREYEKHYQEKRREE